MTNPFDSEPGGLFDGLDDPTPPAFGGDRLPGVMSRGQHLRHQRRMAYAVGSACTAVLVAGAAFGVAATGNGNGGPKITPASPTAAASHTKKPPHQGNTPNPSAGGTRGTGGTATGGKKTPPACVTPTPTQSPPSETPTPTETPTSEPTVTPTISPVAYEVPAPIPTDTVCPSPTATPTSPTEPTETESPPSYPTLPPLLGDGSGADEQPSEGITVGMR